MRTTRLLPSLPGILLLAAALPVDAATFVVTNTADSGPGSLRAAIASANANADLDTIVFDIGIGPVTIALQSELPAVIHPLRIDGLSQPADEAGSGRPRVRLDGQALSASARGLRLNAANCIVAACWVNGLQIVRFPGDGIQVASGSWGLRTLDVGTDGQAALGNGGHGIVLTSAGNRVGDASLADGVLVSGNAGDGIRIHGNNNGVTGSIIGLNRNGNAAIANGDDGIAVFGSGAVVGGLLPGMRNVISGNAGSGVVFATGSASGTALNNRIGTNAAGTAAIGNGRAGIHVFGTGVTLGGNTEAHRNVIAGNTVDNVRITVPAQNVHVRGNHIGTNAAGTAALSAGTVGVSVQGGDGITIGGSQPGMGNLISGNGQGGIGVSGASLANVTIAGNRIGTDATGTQVLPSGGIGIRAIQAGNLTIGGAEAAARNQIAGHSFTQISLESGIDGANVANNLIGTDATGTVALSPGGGLDVGGRNITIGGDTLLGNVISGNAEGGMLIGASAQDLTVAGNRIGTDPSGNVAVPNGSNGIRILGGQQLVIGGFTPLERNIIAGNHGPQLTMDDGENVLVRGNHLGVNADGAAAIAGSLAGAYLAGRTVTFEHNVVSGHTQGGLSVGGADSETIRIRHNRIGVDAAGANPIGNGGNGVRVFAGTGIEIGPGNTIAANPGNIAIEAAAPGTRVFGNRIGTDATGSVALTPNGGGVRVGASDVWIGGPSPSDGNLISGNGHGAIAVGGSATSGVRIAHNHIGTNPAGSMAVPNTGGIRLLAGSGTEIGPGNLVSGNIARGIAIESDAVGTRVFGNRIGTDASGNLALTPEGGGVDIGGDNTVVGGPGAADRNLISGNGHGAIAVQGTVTGVRIRNNRIGSNDAGDAAVPNGGGIRLLGGVGVEIGPDNLIAGNLSRGIAIERDAVGTRVFGNRIGTNAAGTQPLTPNGGGIDIGGRDVVIGGPAAADRNLISGLGHGGINVSGADVEQVRILNNYIGTNAAGSAGIAGNNIGIRVISGRDIRIGAPGAGNVVSGSPNWNLSIERDAREVVVQANHIGVDAAGTAPIAGQQTGIELDAPDSLVGGVSADGANVIAGQVTGIIVARHAIGARIVGNHIGTNAANAANIGNGGYGVILRQAHAVTVGGVEPGAGNTIAHNGGVLTGGAGGILVESGDGNLFVGNAYHDNIGAAIELDPPGPRPNDAFDADVGPNLAQNHPVIRAANVAAGQLSVELTLHSTPASEHLVELYFSPACDASGIGEGRLSLGRFGMTTDADGDASLSTQLPLGAVNGVITALATGPDGSTSEFSPCHGLQGANPGVFGMVEAVTITHEGKPPLVFPIVRSMGNLGPASVRVRTVAGTATPGLDYDAVDIVLHFADGEVVKTVEVAVHADNQAEGQETFDVVLSEATGASLGANASTTVLVVDVGPDMPSYHVSDAEITEPASGTAMLSFTLQLTPNNAPYSFTYETSDGSATAGQDYTATSGTLEVAPSAVVQHIPIQVPVHADALAEGIETLYLSMWANGGSITTSRNIGIGSIRDRTPDRPDAIFRNGFED